MHAIAMRGAKRGSWQGLVIMRHTLDRIAVSLLAMQDF